MKVPRPSESAKEFFKSVLPEDSRVTLKPMFGNLAGFVNGNLFSGLYGDDMFVRLFEENREELLKVKGTSIFEPMKGKQMKDYIVLPKSWMKQKETVRAWVLRSLESVSKLPKKKK